jgi:hypothetical protein
MLYKHAEDTDFTDLHRYNMKYPRQRFDTQANDYLGITSDNNVKNKKINS